MESHSQAQENLFGTVTRNTTFVTIGTIVLKVMGVLFMVYVVRRMGDNRMGQYSTALAFVGLFQIFAELGITQYAMREIARDREKIKSLFWNLVFLRLLLALINLVLIPVAAIIFGYQGNILLGIIIYAASFLLAAFAFPMTMVLTAYEKLGYSTMVNIGSQFTFMVIGSFFLYLGAGFIWLIGANLIGILVQILLAFLFIRHLKITGFKFHLNPSSWLPMIRAGLPFGIISLMLSIAFSIDTVMLSKFVHDDEVGWYGVAYRLVFSLMIFTHGFSQSIVPSLSRVFIHDIDKVKKWYRLSVKFILIISSPIAVGGFLLSYSIISFLYTNEFLPSGLALQILIWDVPLLMFAGFCGDMTTITNEEKSAARIYTVNTVTNVILNLILIPKFGLIGASIVTVLTDLVSAIQFYILLKRKLDLPPITSDLLRTVAAAALMGLLVWLLRSSNFILVIFIGGVFYLLLLLPLKLIGNTELILLQRVLQKIPWIKNMINTGATP